ncbi:MAG: MarR family winged helix-turn-helix transcriptional regulator [Solirubrobacteraceae bacterium]|nr:MarR family winged helix-turn-helix transcriptional regulator [Solirubrobacteraceae bacterium]
MTPPSSHATVARTAAAAPDETVQHLIRQLYGFGAVRRALGKAAQHEIASQGFSALGAIYRTAGPCRVSDVASALQVDLSVASRQIASLVSAGHVERRPDPEDGRAHLLHLTDAGHGALSRAHDGMVDVLSDALADWSRTDVETLASGIERLVDAFNTLPSSDQEVSS